MFIIWIVCGIVKVRFDGSGGWLIMIADSNNKRWTWMAIPALLICWILWPISVQTARFIFLVTP